VIKKLFIKYRAIFFIVGLAVASIGGVVHLFNLSNRRNIELITLTSIGNAKRAFEHQEMNVSNMLSAVLESLLKNEELAQNFLSRNRECLYESVRPLYDNLKSRSRITHWYFLDSNPAKTCFLRVHAPHLFNDSIRRVTLDQCIKSGGFVHGKELGKTALALRAVRPYYYRNHLIGYMELAVQMDDFFDMLKNQTGNEYGLLIKKEFIDRTKWESVISEKAVRDNWDDMEKLLMTNTTCDCQSFERFNAALQDIETIPDSGMVLEKVSKDDTHYVRGIFPFFDASGKKVGGVFILKDITDILNAMELQKKSIVLSLWIFMGLITFFMIYFHKRAEIRLRKYRWRLEELVEESTSELLEANIRLNLEIKEHKDAQTALQQECEAREEAEKKQINAVKHAERSARLASIGVMAASITHEINQPLNAIKVTADSIQYWSKRNPGALPEPFHDQLNIISKSVKRIVEIIRHMRTFWVIPETPKISRIDINDAVRNALSLTRQQLHSHGIREVIAMDSEPLIVKGNMVHLEQIIVNLVVNAINALDLIKQNEKKIEIATAGFDGRASMIISDNGPGLPTTDTTKLFDPFFSTRNSSESGEGMGLGLAIVKQYIDRYNGEIDAQNKPDGGASFRILFPLY
jgi:signal transduction histidine kinase